eukprot:3612784-Amphidinium_carterae.1
MPLAKRSELVKSGLYKQYLAHQLVQQCKDVLTQTVQIDVVPGPLTPKADDLHAAIKLVRSEAAMLQEELAT